MNTSEESKYKMSISLNVLNHLGINLYSNMPAVLSEVIANAWDADASRVDIDFDLKQQTITIKDDGIGMTEADINDKYLRIGYQRRRNGNPELTAKGRKPMGRKGIGKLSLFSIADEISVYSAKGSDENAFLMDANAIKKAAQNGNPERAALYHPKPINWDSTIGLN